MKLERIWLKRGNERGKKKKKKTSKRKRLKDFVKKRSVVKTELPK